MWEGFVKLWPYGGSNPSFCSQAQRLQEDVAITNSILILPCLSNKQSSNFQLSVLCLRYASWRSLTWTMRQPCSVPFLSKIFVCLFHLEKYWLRRKCIYKCSNAGKSPGAPCFCDWTICLNLTFPSTCRIVVYSGTGFHKISCKSIMLMSLECSGKVLLQDLVSPIFFSLFWESEA